ncbi:UPF0061 protein [Novimethylophilus kurashikiensis]|uniref:UPF0061 protein n=1 Tax=Novimethylophilus kurashikiensis TaxID=1825523 RepID=A0A2R5F8G9_9PROT|nr:hypothetical protein [Novimethylophilus kurashikiensis]GBG14325.1 UPF0061 protein [Novimethylophilus kurashikiensis]
MSNVKLSLQFAQKLETAHLELLKADTQDIYWGSPAEIEAGNMVHQLCIDSGIDMAQGEAYCMKATPEEICEYNLKRIAEALSAL